MIGAGPGGLTAARWLMSQGFEPTIFEQGPMLGGQWTGLKASSGVWPTMHTNTSRILTAFSDLEHESDLVFPSNRYILDYLHRDAETFTLTSRIRFGTRIELLSRGERDGWSNTPALPRRSNEWWWPPVDFSRRTSQTFRGWTHSPARRG